MFLMRFTKNKTMSRLTFKKIASSFIILIVCNVGMVSAQSVISQIGVDIDGEAPGDWFGTSVEMSGDGMVVAIGAINNNENGTHSGHVRVLRNISGNWIQIGSDINGEVAEDSFGTSVSLNYDGSILAAGADHADGSGVDAGNVRVFKDSSGTWVQIGGDINGEAAGDFSGCAISLDSAGTTIAIGARANDGSYTNAGQVRIYKFVSNAWEQIGSDVNGPTGGDQFGTSVSLSHNGERFAVGAPGHNSLTAFSGQTRVYRYNSPYWYIVGSYIDGVANYDNSGNSVSLSAKGDVVAIGSKSHDHLGNGTGQVRVFWDSAGTWIEKGQFLYGEAAGDYFGTSVSLSSDGNVLAVGATMNSGNGLNSGSVRLFYFISGTWVKWGPDIDGESGQDNSGWAVSLSANGRVLAVSALRNDSNGADAGHVRMFSTSVPVFSTQVVSACDSFTWINGVTYFDSVDSVYYTHLDTSGCDSIVFLDLTILSNNIVDSVFSCGPFTWIDGNTYTSNNNSATVLFTNSAGCDSLITLNLTIGNNMVVDQRHSCDSLVWIDGLTYTSSNNTATYVLTNSAGCDSIVQLDLVVGDYIMTDSIFACNSYTWIDGNTYYSSNNTASFSYALPGGCDSAINLNLIIEPFEIDIQPSDVYVPIDSFATFHTAASGISPVYQWQSDIGTGFIDISNGALYSGVNTETLTVLSLSLQNDNQIFRCFEKSVNCSDTSSVATLYIVDDTGVSDFIPEVFIIYPNPTSNELNIEGLSGGVFRVFDLSGKLLISCPNTNGKVDVIGIDNGYYLFEWIGHDSVKRQVFFIEK